MGGAWFVDDDGDGYGNPAWAFSEAMPATVEDCADCDDTHPGVYPGAADGCDGIDNDCDGELDEVPDVPWYRDFDLDGYGDANDVAYGCEAPPGYVADATDCDDADSASQGPDTLYADADGDGYGAEGESWTGCEGEPGTATNDDDCDDADPDYAVEVNAFADADGDGYGAGASTGFCEGKAGWSSVNGDCDDTDPSVHPGAAEVCGDAVNNDCSNRETGCGFTDVWYDSEAFASVVGEGPDEGAGAAVATGADLSGDGLDDFLVAAPGTSGNGGEDGAVYGFFGPVTGSMSVASANAAVFGIHGGSVLGESMASLGDVDGDGKTDILVGSPQYQSAAGRVGAAHLVHGPVTADAWLPAISTEPIGGDVADATGPSVAIPGDIDGDGLDDIAVGAPLNSNAGDSSGQVYVMLGPATASAGLGAAEALLRGPTSFAEFGTSVASDCDVDEDGYVDLVVGVPEWSQDAVYVYAGPDVGSFSAPALWAKIEGTSDSRSGAAVACVPPTASTRSGVLAGAPNHDVSGTHRGAACLVLGLDPGSCRHGRVARAMTRRARHACPS